MLGEQSIKQYWPFLVCYGIVYSILFIVILIYYSCWRKKAIRMLDIIAILLVNDLMEAFFTMLGYLNDQNDIFCMISVVGRTVFTIAASFWIVFIIRVLYQQKLSPGKYLNMFKYILRNTFLTYIPSFAVGIFLFIMIQINDSQSQRSCWNNLTEKQPLDYVIYFTSFVLPTFIATVAIIIYCIFYFTLPNYQLSLFLSFPLTAVLFGIYYIGVKAYIFWNPGDLTQILQIPQLIQSLLFTIVFIFLYVCKQKKRIDQDDLTIKSSSFQQSFLDQK